MGLFSMFLKGCSPCSVVSPSSQLDVAKFEIMLAKNPLKSNPIC